MASTRDTTHENPICLLLGKWRPPSNQTRRKELFGPGFRAIWTWFSANLLVVDDAYHIARVLQLKINKRRVRIKARRGSDFSWKLINVGLRLFGPL